MPARTSKSAKTRQKKASPARAQGKGWRTTDADEVERRVQRALAERMRVEPLGEVADPFDSYAVISVSGERYVVEIRCLESQVNSCECPDHEINGLGTCKHIEAVRRRLSRRGRGRSDRRSAANGRVEIFLDPREHGVRVQWPRHPGARSRAERQLARFFRADGAMRDPGYRGWQSIRRALDGLPHAAASRVRVSRCIDRWLDRERRRGEHESARRTFEERAASDPTLLDLAAFPLYPYQLEGVLHLAFTERALLADEMGLGKTAQAIAACVLLRRLHGVDRVLVVSPASLKAEWEEQIAKFCDLDARAVYGTRAARLRQYASPAFFTLVNYEQVRVDVRDLQEQIAPDVVILDEAQRIKNWRSKTAASVKRLGSRYAFVLTGTPLENRIDEVYSIAQFLDPHLFGPLFRFNREFHQLDERGRPVGYTNLHELNRRLAPVMLRRRKEEVDGELPGRTVKTYHVEMTGEQRARYEEYSGYVARLLARAKRRALTPEEFERLQQWLACMRMLCDTTFILDPDHRDSPKLVELARLLDELMESPDRKVIVFSEWERMLELVRERAVGAGIGHAWHTGSVPQKLRRAEINRFKTDDACRLFLSTDSGSVGLNLQVADVVINLDQPWNPARLEQRIARAWRKHQQRPVQVINLVTANSIEERMLHVLEGKRALAASVIDGTTGVRSMAMPSGRAALVERLEALMTAPPAAEVASPTRSVGDDLRAAVAGALGRGMRGLEFVGEPAGSGAAVALVDHASTQQRDRARKAASEVPGAEQSTLEILDGGTLDAIRRLAKLGLISVGPEIEALAAARPEEERPAPVNADRLARARDRAKAHARTRALANTLAAGGFLPEAVAPMREAAEAALEAAAWALDAEVSLPVPIATIEQQCRPRLDLPIDLLRWVAAMRSNDDRPIADRAPETLFAARQVLDAIDRALG